MTDIKPRIEIRKKIKEQIDPIVHNYFLNAHPNLKFPYSVSDIKEGNDEVHLPYYLEIEIIDEASDTTKIETICDELKEKLDRKREVTENFAYVIYFDSCNTKIDEEKFIKVRVITFEIKMYVYKKGE